MTSTFLMFDSCVSGMTSTSGSNKADGLVCFLCRCFLLADVVMDRRLLLAVCVRVRMPVQVRRLFRRLMS